MATESIQPGALQGHSASERSTPALGIGDIVTAIMTPLASIKLTVFLLLLATIVVFIATVQQSWMDMWSVKRMHYDSWIIGIPYQHLFVERWFPSMQNVPGKFYIPSGKAIIYALLVNLCCAHMLRYRIKATGVKLWLGAATAVAAGLVTWLITFNTLSSDGFQKEPPISYRQMWQMMQIVLLGLSLSCVAGIFLSKKGDRIRKSVFAACAFVGFAMLGTIVGLGEKSFIGNEGMRILWQLAQATIAACVGWLACVLLFHRKAGIVLLHFGVAGLMLNELYVTYTNDENRIQFSEGQTTSRAYDTRDTEFFIVDRSDPESDKISVIPESILKSGEWVKGEGLPFQVRCVEFMDNSTPVSSRGANEGFTGIGKFRKASDIDPFNDDRVDVAAAVIELQTNDGQPLGKQWLASQWYTDLGFVFEQEQYMIDAVEVDGKQMAFGLRYRSEYKPYELGLKDVRAEYYPGTKEPKWFSSNITLTDLESKTQTSHEIYMNNPLRYGGETFYQSNYRDLGEGTEQSVLQVVRNHGWMIPYICCMFTVVGLAAQFCSSLVAHLEKNQKKRDAEISKLKLDDAAIAPGQDRAKSRVAAMLSLKTMRLPGILAFVALGLYALSGLMKANRPVETTEGMRLDPFGQIPILSEGRVQPLDSFARNTARQFSKREFVYDGDLEKQPAIKWLADTMFQAPGHDKYKLFRIEDLEVLQSLELPAEATAGEPKGARFRYSLEQLVPHSAKIRSIVPDPEQVPPETWTAFQKRINQVRIRKLITQFLGVVVEQKPVSEVGFGDVMARGRLPSNTIRLIPDAKGSDTWHPLSKGQNLQWIQHKAKELNVKTVSALLGKLAEDSESEFSRFRQMQIVDGFFEMPEFRADMDKSGIEEVLSSQKWRSVLRRFEGAVDGGMHAMLTEFNSGEHDIDTSGENDVLGTKLAGLFAQMGEAWRSNNAEQFNELTGQYLAAVNAHPKSSSQSGKLAVEGLYNGWSPFYIAMVLYLFGFAAVLAGWSCFGFSEAMGKNFFAIAVGIMVVAVLVQFTGLVMRVYISGRPPTTNLYSSAITVSAIFVLVMLLIEYVTKLGIGSAMGCIGAFAALMWAWTMSIVDGDTFTVLVAVLDTQFWLSTHVVCITIGYAVTFAAGVLGVAYILATMFTPVLDKQRRRLFANLIYGVSCCALFFSFFGTVLGGLWGDDSWGRFWGWDPKENGALMIVLWSALLLHARWGGVVKERGLAIIAALGNVVVLWSWKGVNSMGVGLHAYAGTSDDLSLTYIVIVALVHVAIVLLACVPTKFWYSHIRHVN